MFASIATTVFSSAQMSMNALIALQLVTIAALLLMLMLCGGGAKPAEGAAGAPAAGGDAAAPAAGGDKPPDAPKA
ncbi:hypothetical protein TTRE_0000822001 [Trichuris trichiura]|uniref:Uncharacterized protein n=1 Tax=Trichuris trichiura TaxID=36087 RepID=A0A077ZHQ0_TRITR|nr:hypothetical protein TTRE_0000822001 [Trichuris trichiura]